MERQSAETLALQALGWIASQEGLFDAFLHVTGATVEDVRRNADRPAFLVGVLDFLMAEDARVMSFCDDNGLDYRAPMQARMAMPGGEPVHWT
ncbi:DUF3572 domain-containing protein [Cereibacter sphaeroides]|uniref:DUF3572 domain-containing protein n=1 Tax=Rhodobacterales TaxID=204455 RepID=UPI000BBED45C|nr:MULTISPECIES: DUF3572 domain-containing protein [Paracoccaceae]MCE6951043.1 DUF3572 domain-containing protein [Cereibacter sphaeroides]MCE6957819.1 DUF3572 domain-containing protein [Cereibacter sphaeroides]MCE6969523.1 DUF3572 domain-containing protein [Cereibacter sphaeroides]MCE6972719.1 DUF3572 domain-containing protein [Cereibacter sphaeroides]